MSAIVGIDFGSRVCRTAVAIGATAEVVANSYSERPLPVFVEWQDRPDNAADAPVPVLTFSSLKQKLGIEETASLQGRDVRIDEHVRAVFQQLRRDAEEASGHRLEKAVVTVPGCFTERQRSALRAAARSCFTSVRLLDDSLAAVLGSATPIRQRNVLAYSLGAGVFSTSVMLIAEGRPRLLASDGHRGIGGYTLDAAVTDYVLGLLHRTPAQFSSLEDSATRLRSIAEHLKIGLSRRSEEQFDVDGAELFVAQEGGDTMNRGLAISRDEFDAKIGLVVSETLNLSQRIVTEAGLSAGDINAILLIGASTKVPLIQKRLGEVFPGEAIRANNTDAAKGAAMFGGQLADSDWQQSDEGAEPHSVPQSAPSTPPLVRPQPATEGQSRPVVQGTWARPFLPAFEEAESQWKKGEQESSIALFEQLIQNSVKFLGNLYSQRGDSLAKAGDLDAAIGHLKHAIRCNASDRFATRSYHQALNRKATELFKARRFVDARTMIREGLALDPNCTSCQQVAAQIEREIQSASRGGVFSRKKRRR